MIPRLSRFRIQKEFPHRSPLIREAKNYSSDFNSGESTVVSQN